MGHMTHNKKFDQIYPLIWKKKDSEWELMGDGGGGCCCSDLGEH